MRDDRRTLAAAAVLTLLMGGITVGAVFAVRGLLLLLAWLAEQLTAATP